MIGELRKLPEFKQDMEKLKEQRPPVKDYDPKNPNAAEEWKYECARREGFDFLYQLITGVRP